jgi:hypothetical protein
MQEANGYVLAARRLIQALLASNNEEYRLALLKRVVKRLGDAGYPRFLKMLLIIAESKDERAKKLLAETLGLALKRMDLPSGQLTSWGASQLQTGEAMSAGLLSGMMLAGAPKRSFGPIEYLTVWFGQNTQRQRLSAEVYSSSLATLIDLLGRSQLAAQLYPLKLDADAQNELEGAYTRTTRDRLRLIAQSWAAAQPAAKIAEQASNLAGPTDALSRQSNY